ncbi:uncharacterized protein LOC132271047 isoform X2 [Cornus florida]|uniref:uncharacterized protein LOC132271047 isoform X2 n=1 Tax=Cornus florida TaxID=4283 RepID=UPI0028A2A000|nr:uncharacterized protein LOC132271047 isoform X2 [Cornus florida]
MAILLRCLRLGGRKICNTKKLGFVASHRPIPSWSFFTTTTGTTTLPAEEGSLDEHHHMKEAVGDGLENLGVASSEKQRDAEIKPRVELLARFAAFSIRDEQNAKKIEFKRVGSAKVQLVRDGRLYYFTIEALVGGVKKFYEAHVLDTLIERNSISLIEWCEVKSPPKSSTSSSSFDSPQNGFKLKKIEGSV